MVDSYSYVTTQRVPGQADQRAGGVPQQLRYAGYWYDNELAWYWLAVRSYDPALERFLQPDPSEIEGLFNYIYAGDNPADRIDPSGLSTAASRSRAVPLPPQVGNLLTAHGNIESNVQVGSTQWYGEISGGGAQPHGGMQGDLGSSAVPSMCVDGQMCQVGHRPHRAGMAVAAAHVDCGICDGVGEVFSAIGGLISRVIDGVRFLCDATICGDLDKIRNGPWYMKILATGDILITFVPGVDVAEKAGEILIRGGGKLTARLAEDEAARVAEVIGRVCKTFCFPKGTLIATEHGGKRIEDVQTGDSVLTEDPLTGKVESEHVLGVQHDPPAQVMAIGLADGSTVEVTPEHPFWVDRGLNFAGPGWLKAGELHIGDQLRTASGAEATVVSLHYHVANVEVYTLTLGRNHDFFVGTARVLVHNCAPNEQTFSIADRVHGQLQDPRLGPLAGKLTPEDLQRLVNNPAANRYYDARNNSINVIQTIDGRLIRITVAPDALRIYSVGPIQPRNVANLVRSGNYYPLP